MTDLEAMVELKDRLGAFRLFANPSQLEVRHQIHQTISQYSSEYALGGRLDAQHADSPWW